MGDKHAKQLRRERRQQQQRRYSQNMTLLRAGQGDVLSEQRAVIARTVQQVVSSDMQWRARTRHSLARIRPRWGVRPEHSL